MRQIIIIVVLAITSPAVLPSIAAAQTENDAREMFQQGAARLQRAERLRGAPRNRAIRQALDLFHNALRVARTRSILFNIGLCYEYLHRYEDAVSYFNEDFLLDGLTEQYRRDTEQRIAGITPRIALVEVTTDPPGATIFLDRRDLAPRGVTPRTIATQPGQHRIITELDGHEPGEGTVEAVLGETREVRISLTAHPATVRVETVPPGAEIRFDDEDGPSAGITPLTVEIEPGQHRAYATLGDRSGRQTFDAPPGDTITVEVSLAAPTSPGVVIISVDVPDATVLVEGVTVGRAPIRELMLTPGIHRISVVGGDEYENWSEAIEIGPGHEINLEVHLAPIIPSRRFGIWPGVGMVAATVLGLAAMATGVWALSLHANFEAIEATCQDNEQACDEDTVLREEAFDLDQRTRRFAIATDVLISTAAVTGIISFALMLLNREIPYSSRAQIALAPSPGGAIASLGFGHRIRMSP